MIDPITKEILKEMNLPLNTAECLLYMNTLLEHTRYSKVSDMSNFRLRGSELINGYLYKMMADAIKIYRDQRKSGRKDATISIKKDKLLKTMLDSRNVEEYSVLNPILELETKGAASMKGLNGINLNDAYTKELRAYNESMEGLISLNNPDSDKAGISRFLTLNPKISDGLGSINKTENLNDLTADQILSPAELLSPFTAMHSDPPKLYWALH
jgi:hypothetical protein